MNYPNSGTQPTAEGDASPLSERESILLQAVYPELRKRAAVYLKRERPDHTLQPTALVHEAWFRLARVDAGKIANREHLFALASRIMGRILKDHARTRNAGCHGGRSAHVNLEDANSPAADDQVFKLIVNSALERLKELDERFYRVIQMRFFDGLTETETADRLGVSVRTVKRDFRMAKAWLRVELENVELEKRVS